MTLPIWPWRLLTPNQPRARLTNAVLAGPPSIASLTQTVRVDGGGLWMFDHKQIICWDQRSILAARAWSAALDGGVTPFVLPLWDLAYAPRPLGVLPTPPAGLNPDDWFGQPAEFGAPIITASVGSIAALRATQLIIEMSAGTVPLRGGEHFSIEHPTLGWRLYRVVSAQNTDIDEYTCQIRPPLREVSPAQTPVEFDVPRCTVKLIPGRADALEPDLEGGQRAVIDLYAMEAFA